MGQRADDSILVMIQRGKGALIIKQPTVICLNITTAFNAGVSRNMWGNELLGAGLRCVFLHVCHPQKHRDHLSKTTGQTGRNRAK